MEETRIRILGFINHLLLTEVFAKALQTEDKSAENRYCAASDRRQANESDLF